MAPKPTTEARLRAADDMERASFALTLYADGYSDGVDVDGVAALRRVAAWLANKATTQREYVSKQHGNAHRHQRARANQRSG